MPRGTIARGEHLARVRATVRELVSWLAQHEHRSSASRGGGLLLDPGDADLVLCQAPVEDTLGGWSTVASALLLGAKTLRPMDTGEGRLAARERLLRTLRASLIDAHRGSRREAPAVVYVPHADVVTIAAVALAGAGAGYRLRTIPYQRDAHAAANGSPAAAVFDFDRDVPLLRDQAAADGTPSKMRYAPASATPCGRAASPCATDGAAVAALESLAAKGLLAPLRLREPVASRSSNSSSTISSRRSRTESAPASRAGRRRRRRRGRVRGDRTARCDCPSATASSGRSGRLLSASRDVDTRSLLRRIYALFRGIETPDRELVERCVAAYATQTDEGRWRLQGQDALVARQASQAQVLAEPIDTGHRLGFKVHVGRDVERRALPSTHAERGE